VNTADRYLSAPVQLKQASSPTCESVDVLEDGTYDAVVVDAVARGETMSIDLTILGGVHKGEVTTVEARGMEIDEVDLLGMPGTLVVENGVPVFTVER